MKKSKILLCFSIIFLMFLSTTNVYASENVKIKSIDLVDKSVNASETSKATFNGLTMNFNIRFLSVDDYAKYKIVVENKENKDYDISVDSKFNSSKYITYEYEKTDSLKANSESEFYVTVTYKNEVDENSFSDGKYIEKNSAVLKLDDSSIGNPVTSNNEVMVIIGLLVMTFVFFVLFRNNKSRKISLFVLLGILSLPLLVKAVDYLKITVNSNVVIEKEYSVGYEVKGYIKASEASYYDLSHAYLIRTVYVGSVSEENKYLHYGAAIYKGNKLYPFGDIVSFDPDSIIIYDFDINDCHGVDEDGSTYGTGNPGDLICGTPKKDSGYSSYRYNRNYIIRFGYKCNPDDNTIMKFSKATDDWQNGGNIDVNNGSTFIMPNHDVVFTQGPD